MPLDADKKPQKKKTVIIDIKEEFVFFIKLILQIYKVSNFRCNLFQFAIPFINKSLFTTYYNKL